MSNQYNWDLQKTGLNSEFWRKFVRPRVLEIKGNVCEMCSSKGKVDVHHTNYELQTIHTLKVLCRKCHKKLHKTGVKGLSAHLNTNGGVR